MTDDQSVVAEVAEEVSGEVGRVRMSPEKRRLQLIQSAEELFARYGVDGTSVSDIVGHAGVAQGTFYWYFKSKDDIVHAVVDSLVQEVLQEISQLSHLKGMSGEEKLDKVLSTFCSWMARERAVMEHLSQHKHGTLYGGCSREMNKQMLPILEEIIIQAVEEGDFNTSYPREAAIMVLASCQSIFYGQNSSLLDDESLYQAFIEFVLHGLHYRPDKPGNYRQKIS